MSHAEVIIQELTQRESITLPELLAAYGPRGYTYTGFLQAAWLLRKRGRLARGRQYRGIYVRAGCCPTCRRPL